MLKFRAEWRFDSPGAIPDGVVTAFVDLIGKIATQGDRQTILEHFKSYFGRAAGTTTTWSSSASWAETDLSSYMQQAADNAPLLIEAFYDTCQSLPKLNPDFAPPPLSHINRALRETESGWEIQPPNLILHDSAPVPVVVKEQAESLDQKAREIIQQSLSKSEELLANGHYRPAVQESLWLMETVITAFQGLETDHGTIEGKYFNKIVGDLRKHHKGKALHQVLNWMMALHGYLSSPTGGRIRHGADLSGDVEINRNEARLFCNLILSYVNFLIFEHNRLSKSDLLG
jgi:hypothetical protein